MTGQTNHPFKLSSTRDSSTSHAGLALFGEFARGLKLKPRSRRHLPGPGDSAFFPVVVMAYNLFRIFELKALGPEWASFRLRKVRRRFYNVAGKLAINGGAIWLKVPRYLPAFFIAVRQRAWSFACG